MSIAYGFPVRWMPLAFHQVANLVVYGLQILKKDFPGYLHESESTIAGFCQPLVDRAFTRGQAFRGLSGFLVHVGHISHTEPLSSSVARKLLVPEAL